MSISCAPGTDAQYDENVDLVPVTDWAAWPGRVVFATRTGGHPFREFTWDRRHVNPPE